MTMSKGIPTKPGRWAIEAIQTRIAGHIVYVASVTDLDSLEVVGLEVSASAAAAMTLVFGSAVFNAGEPAFVLLDHGADGDAVAQGALRLGAEVRRVAP